MLKPTFFINMNEILKILIADASPMLLVVFKLQPKPAHHMTCAPFQSPQPIIEHTGRPSTFLIIFYISRQQQSSKSWLVTNQNAW